MLFLSKEDWKKLSLKKKIWFIIGDLFLIITLLSMPVAIICGILLLFDLIDGIEIGGIILIVEFIIFFIWYVGSRS